jgi:hypothetical protein
MKLRKEYGDKKKNSLQAAPYLISPEGTRETPGNHPQSYSVAIQGLFSTKTAPKGTGKTRRTTKGPAKQPQTGHAHKKNIFPPETLIIPYPS